LWLFCIVESVESFITIVTQNDEARVNALNNTYIIYAFVVKYIKLNLIVRLFENKLYT